MQINQHDNLCNHNEAFLNHLLSSKSTYYDWLVTVTFYTSLHKMHSCLHIKGVEDYQIDEHYKLRKLIATIFPHLSPIYDMLHIECRKVRYEQVILNAISDDYLNDLLDVWKLVIKPFYPE